jgi:DNA primase
LLTLSAQQRSWLEKVTATAEQNLSEAAGYLESRGIDPEVAAKARLGVVGTSVPTAARWAGRLCIPYLSRAGVLSLKFRAMNGEEPKYLCPPNSHPLLYGVTAFQIPSPVIGITEGELDALVLTHMVGIPAVGCPGASTWQKHHPRCFAGYDQVLVFADGDAPGQELAKRIGKDLSQATVVLCPDGTDVNSLYLSEGAEGIRKRAGLE